MLICGSSVPNSCQTHSGITKIFFFPNNPKLAGDFLPKFEILTPRCVSLGRPRPRLDVQPPSCHSFHVVLLEFASLSTCGTRTILLFVSVFLPLCDACLFSRRLQFPKILLRPAAPPRCCLFSLDVGWSYKLCVCAGE